MPDDVLKDLFDYHSTVADAVTAVGESVRALVGGDHWLSVGTYKERLIRTAVRKTTPLRYSVGDGFLLRPQENGEANHQISKQIDVLVYDAFAVAPVFQDNEFAVVLSGTALAAIEVKSKFSDDGRELEEGVDNLLSAVRVLQPMRNQAVLPPLFTAIVGFQNERLSKTGGNPNPRSVELAARTLKKAFRSQFLNEWQGTTLIATHSLGNYDDGHVRPVPQVVCPLLGSTWVAVTGNVASADRRRRCPTVQFFTTQIPHTRPDSGERNHSLHLLLALLDRHYRRAMQSTSMGREEIVARAQTQLHFGADYKPLGRPIALITESEAESTFPDVRFLK